MTRRQMFSGLLTLALFLALAAEASSHSLRLRAEFGEDDYDDLVIGVPYDKVGAHHPGTVAVFYGSSYPGLSGVNGLWDQNASGAWNGAEDGDEFGKALAAGDFDGDGYYDLAVGVPHEDFENPWSFGNAGAVTILYGAASGVTSRSQLFYQNLLTDAATGDRYGSALAAGDFNGDGYDDLAVGVPGEDSLVAIDIGAVNIVYGRAIGLGSTGKQQWHQDVPGILNSAEPGDEFGSALATGDFNGDRYADLAIGIPGEDSEAGAVSVLYGGPLRLTEVGNEFWQQKIGNSDAAEAGDRLGWALAAGNFDGDRYTDLAIGVPYEDIEGIVVKFNAGAVDVVYGSASGLYNKHGWWFHQDLLDLTDTAEGGDTFGWALAAGDFDGNGCDDLAVGVPHEDIGAWPGNNGLVNVVYGTVNGLGTGGPPDQMWWQGAPDIAGSPSENDRFGWALVTIPAMQRIYLPLIQRSSS